MKTQKNLLSFIILVSIISCSNNSDLKLNIDNHHHELSIIEYSELFGNTHNECLDYIHNELNRFPIQDKSLKYDNLQRIVKIANDFYHIKQSENPQLKSDGFQEITLEEIDTMSIDKINTYTSEIEKEYIKLIEDKVNLPDWDVNIDSILDEITIDDRLTSDQKYQLGVFIVTAKKSYQYWIMNNLDNKSIDINPRVKSAGAVVLADAYYGWWFTLGSGGNLLFGGAAAAIASIGAAMYTE